MTEMLARPPASPTDELAKLHAVCDRYNLPYDAELLVEHVRENAHVVPIFEERRQTFKANFLTKRFGELLDDLDDARGRMNLDTWIRNARKVLHQEPHDRP